MPLLLHKIKNINSFVIKQVGDREFFISSPDGIIFSMQSFSQLLLALLEYGIISPQLLEGVLEEYNTEGSHFDTSKNNLHSS